ncbi:MAG: hypothetical protein AAFO06_04730, partial [Cyanobacteria bacterium J06597_16]
MIYTFYSFKGGVGRSMALANVAELLYRIGLKVLIIDFDLEAPGLEDYFDTEKSALALSEMRDRRGLIDMLISYKKVCSLKKNVLFDRVDTTDDFGHILENPIKVFCCPIYSENDKNGGLSIIHAGKRSKRHISQYAKKIETFDWEDFYVNWEGEKFFNWFRVEINKIADVVLIDSRTGISEMGGVCTHHLADAVVMFVATNNQNLNGCRLIASSLANPDLIEKGRGGRSLHILPVPSRVEDSEADSLDRFANAFKSKLGPFIPKNILSKEKTFSALRIPYVPY